MSEKFVQTVSSVNYYNNSDFSFCFSGQEYNQMINGIIAENDQELKNIYMPAYDFMYVLPMAKGKLEKQAWKQN
ncbi:hypothetical protein FE392_10580 [Xenorhabdus sp. 12]|uniref:Uncharacterized protein n=1 Tax=Xenorhabdus santafensis TaxID=2582833 RepID=A0ABU4SAI0_9GAMM|nr:hypothetical protein [Xenorhabdus sp. 12]MDX7987770.1 hypothetical protein [Xenorhabdus sp. 12]